MRKQLQYRKIRNRKPAAVIVGVVLAAALLCRPVPAEVRMTAVVETEKDHYVGDWELAFAIFMGEMADAKEMGAEMAVILHEDGSCELNSKSGDEEDNQKGTWTETETGVNILDENDFDTPLIYDESADCLYLPMDDSGSNVMVFVRSGDADAVQAAKDHFAAPASYDEGWTEYEIEKKTVMDQGGIKIETTGAVHFSKEKGADIHFTATNGSDHGAAVSVKDDAAYINDLQVPCASRDFSAMLAAGETKEVTLHFDEKVMQFAKIEEIGSIDLQLQASNTDDYTATPAAGDAQAFTTGKEAKGGAPADAPVLFEGKGIRILNLGENTLDSTEGYVYPVMYLVENTADTRKTLIPWSSTINGEALSIIGITNLLPGKSAIGRPLIFESSLAEKNIKDVKDITSITCAFHVTDEEGGESGLTEEVKLK